MAHHGRAGKNRIPSGNMPRNTETTPEAMKAVSEQKSNARGRTAKLNPNETDSPQASKPHTEQVMRREVNRATKAGVKKRGDRRDMVADPGMRGKGQSRSSGAGKSKALTGKASGGRQVGSGRGRANSK